MGAGGDPTTEHAAAWDAYYRARGEQPPAPEPVTGAPGAPLTDSPNLMGQPGLPGQQPQQGAYPQYGGYGVDNVAAGMNRMTVGQ
jgi:hypothetical protein